MADATASRIEEPKDLGDDDAGTWAYWNSQEKIALKGEKQFRKRGQKIDERYRDERGAETGVGNTRFDRFNILWSNVQTLMPILYGQTPKADVQRRFKDEDATGRFASEILERTLEYSMEEYDFDSVMKAVVEDKCLPGRGTARVIYVPHFGEPIANPEWEAHDAEGSLVDNPGDKGQAAGAEAGQETDPEASAPPTDATREVVYEEVCVSYVFWEDYLEGPARTWRQVPWLRYRAYLTRAELVARFGAKGKKVNLDFTMRGTDADDEKTVPDDLLKKAIVHETWDRTRKKVYWWAPGTPELILDQIDDPLELKDFYPSPDPVFATKTNTKRIPVADYIEYQDQARELDNLTGRIDRLTKCLKVAGVYAGSEKAVLQQLVEDVGENKLVPVEDWAAFAIDKGGVANLIQWLPIAQVADCLIQLYDAREKVKQIIYELTGIADIMRGSSAPEETARAQSLKSSFSSRRIAPQQRAVAEFARGLIRLMAGVIMKHFEPKTISMITGLPVLLPVPQLPPPPQAPPAQILGRDPATGMGTMVPNPAMQQFQQVMQQYQAAQQQVQQLTAENQKRQGQFDAAVAMLRQDAHTTFRIDIESDSTITPDEQQEKADRIEFLSKFVPLMEQTIPISQGNPPLAALTKEIVLFAIRGFKVARSLEESVEKAFDAIAKMPPQPPKGAKDPAEAQAVKENTQIKAKTEMQKVGTEAQVDMAHLEESKAERIQKGQLEAAGLVLEAKRLDKANESHDIRNEAVEHRMAGSLT